EPLGESFRGERIAATGLAVEAPVAGQRALGAEQRPGDLQPRRQPAQRRDARGLVVVEHQRGWSARRRAKPTTRWTVTGARRFSQSVRTDSKPIRTRGLLRSMARTITRAAFSGERVQRAKSSIVRVFSSASAALEVRDWRTMLVLIPPGCTQVTPTRVAESSD